MKKNRDMFYSDYQSGAFTNPIMQPQGYMINSQYQAFGPNAIPNNYNNHNNNYNMNETDYFDEIDNRVSKLETQIRRLDNRISRLENNQIESVNVNNDTYMI